MVSDALKQIWEKVDEMTGPKSMETVCEHIARDMREGRFPQQSERQMVPENSHEEMPHEITAWHVETGPMTGHWSANQHPAEAETYVRKSDVKALLEAGRYMLNHAEWREQNEGVFWEASDLMRAALAAFRGDATSGRPDGDAERWRETAWRLRSYAIHDDDCTRNRHPHYRGCSCGLQKLLDSMEEQNKPETRISEQASEQEEPRE